MANEIRKITLTQYNGESGPAYNVEYSTDCITYSQSVDCTNLFLPSIGSFGLCTVDEDTTCVRLTSINSPCTNSVIEDLRPTTTTTTTTSTTTTSTTTTAAPTTTTTTIATTTTTTTVGQITADFFGAGITNELAFETCNNGTTYSFGLIGDEVNFCTAEVLVLDITAITSSIPFNGTFYLSKDGFVRAFQKFGFDPSAYSIGLCEFCSNFTTTTTTTSTTTTTTTAAPSTDCYVIETIQSAPGECFDCEGFFASSTDTIITFFDGCSGSIIPAPFDINVEARYSDNSTGSTFIPAGATGSILIAFSDVQCAPLPECGEITSPTFESASVVPVSGSIGECCVPTTTTTTTESPFV